MRHYEGLPEYLEREHIDPYIPWLYGFKLDFRFRRLSLPEVKSTHP
jgi:hypothetical protein